MSYSKALRSGVWYTISNFLMRGVGFITTPIFTRIMTKSEYGDFSNIQTWMFIALYITSLDLEASLIRASFDYKEDLDRYVHSLISLSILSTFLFGIITIVFRRQFISLLSMDGIYINCMLVYLLFCPAVNIFQNAERYRFNYKWTVATSLLITVGSSILSVLLVIVMNNKLLGRTMGFILPTAVVGLAISIYYFVKGRPVKTEYWRYALPITLPYIPHLLSMYLLSNMDRVMIRRLISPEAAALYTLAYTCGFIITILVTSVNSAFSPWLAEKLADGDHKSIRRISVPYVGFFSIAAFGMVLITPEILYVLGGKPYLEAKYVMPPVAAGCLFQYVYSMYVNVEQFEKKTAGMAAASAMAAGLNFVLNAIFIPRYGYVAAAYTTYAGYFFLYMIHMLYVRRLGMGDVYDNRKILGISVAASLLIFFTNYLLDKNVLRLGIFIIYLVLIALLMIRHRLKIVNVIRLFKK